MCIHPCMSIQHEIIWSTTYCVPAQLYAQHCILRAKGLCPRGSHQFAHLWSIRERGVFLPVVCAYSFSVYRIRFDRYVFSVMWALGQSCIPAFFITVYVHYMFMNATRFIYQYQLNQVFNSSSTSTVFISVSIFFDSASVFLSIFILAELCSSPCTLHHSRYQRGSTRGGSQWQWCIVCVRGTTQDERYLGESDQFRFLF